MKVLVYGAGVIGGQLVHALSVSGNDVTVIARGLPLTMPPFRLFSIIFDRSDSI